MFKTQFPTTIKFEIFKTDFNFGQFLNFTTYYRLLIFDAQAFFSETASQPIAAFLVRIIVQNCFEKWCLAWQFRRFWRFFPNFGKENFLMKHFYVVAASYECTNTPRFSFHSLLWEKSYGRLKFNHNADPQITIRTL